MATRGINKVTILGHIGQDPEIRYSQDGKAIANITIATSESWKDQSGQIQEKTEWHKVSMFGKLAEIAGEYLRKGSQVYIEGKLQTRKWQDQQGQDRYTTEIVLDPFNGVMQMLGGKSEQSSGASQGASHQPQQQGQGAPKQQNQYQQRQCAAMPQQQQQQAPNRAPQNNGMPPPNFDFEDDVIPFAPIGLQYRQLHNCM